MTKAHPVCVLDASALLASAFGESGAEVVRGLISGALISAANWSEFLQKCAQFGVDTEGMRDELQAAGLQIVPVSVAHAERAAALWPLARAAGLSLGDRLCLALGEATGATTYTADRIWLSLDLGVKVVCVRPPREVHQPAVEPLV